MAKKFTPVRRPSILVPVLLVIVVPLFLIGGTLGTLVALGIELPFMTKAELPSLKIPANPRPLQAYARVRRDDLIDFETGQINYMKMPPRSAIGASLSGTTIEGAGATGRVRSVEDQLIQGNTYPVFILDTGDAIPLPNVDMVEGVYLDFGKIIGRVLDRDKSPNFGFTERNFLPEGTRPGTVGGVPQGMKAYTLGASKLTGVHGLRIGDKIDILASVALADLSPGSAIANQSTLIYELQNPTRSGNSKDKTYEPRLVASEAIVIAPVYQRSKTTSSSSLIDGTRSRTAPVEEVVLAVHEEDIPAITEVLALDVSMMIVAHSGRPEDSIKKEIPEGMVEVPLNPRQTVPYTEMLKSHLLPSGSKRIKTILLAEEQVKDLKIITQPESIIGRVIRRTKKPGSFFTEDDFFPLGTLPGLAAAVPQGKLALTVDAAKIQGIDGMSLGDQFDLISTTPVDFEKIAQNIGSKDYVVSSAIRNGALRLNNQAHSTVILRNAQMIAPPESIAMKVHGSSSSDTSRNKTKPMVIAIDPQEVPVLTTALSTSSILTAILRNEDQSNSEPIPESLNPANSVRVLDSVIGKDRKPFVFVTDSTKGPAKPIELQNLLPKEDSGERLIP